jgi:murein L,D-transpeptidase YcbB/YkuD
MVPLTRISRTGFTLFGPLLAATILSWPGSPAPQADLTVMPLADSGKIRLQQARLESALDRYQQIRDAGGWPAIPGGPTIRPGARDSRIAALARRLTISGDLGAARYEFLEYDGVLQSAVLRFQSRHGLDPDALVGRQTLHALNVSAEQRVGQIRVTLDRLQDLFETERSDFVLINVPAFEMYLVRAGEMVWTSKVVVGETDAKTPLFEATMKHVVLNPTWTVPRSIASEELLPRIQRDLGFLSRGDYELRDRDGSAVDPLSVDWPSLHQNNFPYTLVQQAGPRNELGKVKFLFPNEYGVCMHDTPGKQLFERYTRAFSHGCIRLENPVDFAAELLDEEGWTREHVDAQLESTETRTIVLAKPIPVMITYLTTAVDKAGTVYFYRDIYNKDAESR